MVKFYEFYIFIVFFYYFFSLFFFDENMYYLVLVSFFCLPHFEGIFVNENIFLLMADFSAAILVSVLDNIYYYFKLFYILLGIYFLKLLLKWRFFLFSRFFFFVFFFLSDFFLFKAELDIAIQKCLN